MYLKQQLDLLKTIITQVKSPSQKPSDNKSAQYKVGDSCPECGNTLETRSAIRGKRIGQRYRL